jgi:hypothetical protein
VSTILGTDAENWSLSSSSRSFHSSSMLAEVFHSGYYRSIPSLMIRVARSQLLSMVGISGSLFLSEEQMLLIGTTLSQRYNDTPHIRMNSLCE